MKRLLRPSTIFVLLGLLVAAGAIWVYESTKLPERPVPPPLDAADEEVAWLNSATSAVAWERFVQAVEAVTRVKAGAETFPRLTTAAPEIAVPLANGRGKLRFRWYKLTSEWTTEYWVDQLVSRKKPPLAIIGGNTSEQAIDQASQLQRATQDLPESARPLLLLTTATADRLPVKKRRTEPAERDMEARPLTDLYSGRTFRFCFSNRQMGAAVTQFIWSRDELRPDAFPAYLARWNDDPYSEDLTQGFTETMLMRQRLTAAVSDWGQVTGCKATGGLPAFALHAENALSLLALEAKSTYIAYGVVGSFDRPNRYEAEAARQILSNLDAHPLQQRPLLILSGQSTPSRRLMRALYRLSPEDTRRFVLAAGDSMAFNTIYRDREVTWPIQDIPCSLVFFSHYNPVDERSFRRDNSFASGAEDLLLNEEIVRAIVSAASAPEGECRDANCLRDRLHNLRYHDGGVVLADSGEKLFDDNGNRRDGTGEHVVWLQPRIEGRRVNPDATIFVYGRQTATETWVPRGKAIAVYYTGASLNPNP